MKMKKTIPALPVQDIQQSIEFYTNKLGFTARHYDEGFAIMVRDDVEIHLWKSGDDSWKNKVASLVENPVCSGAESFIAGTASCRIQVEGVEELFEEYKNKNVLHSVSTKVEEQPWGDKEFHAVDIHRNLLTFYEEI
ncbi:MAG: VOC family protein [Sphingobacteriales bacterium]|nr:MAG: VOC family protein [Sphingobacteriales bacterium]